MAAVFFGKLQKNCIWDWNDKICQNYHKNKNTFSATDRKNNWMANNSAKWILIVYWMFGLSVLLHNWNLWLIRCATSMWMFLCLLLSPLDKSLLLLTSVHIVLILPVFSATKISNKNVASLHLCRQHHLHGVSFSHHIYHTHTHIFIA